MESSNINSMLIGAVLAVAGFISIQVWDLRKEVTQNAVVIENMREKVVVIEQRLQRQQSFIKKENRHDLEPHS